MLTMIPKVDGEGLLIGPDRNHIEAEILIYKMRGAYEVRRGTHN